MLAFILVIRKNTNCKISIIIRYKKCIFDIWIFKVFQFSRIFMAAESPFMSSIVFLVGNPFRRQLWLWQGVISTKARKTFMWWRRKRSESLHRMCKLHLLDDLRVMILRDRLFYANAWLKWNSIYTRWISIYFCVYHWWSTEPSWNKPRKLHKTNLLNYAYTEISVG